MDDIVINKSQSIQRCVKRARDEYRLAGENFATDYTRQDAAMLNVVRGCELAIDLANHVLRKRRLGIPTVTREAFELLRDAGIISSDLCTSMLGMVGFRNVVVHQYQRIDIEIVRRVIERDLDDLLAFVWTIVAQEE